MKDVRFSEPNLLMSIYEELRNAKNIRKMMKNDLKRVKNKMMNCLDRCFPEYQEVYASWEAKSFLYILEKYKLPSRIAELDIEKVYSEVREKYPRGIV